MTRRLSETRRLRSPCLSGLCALFASTAARADPPQPSERAGFHEPVGPERWSVRLALGASMDVLPRALVASELRQVPMVTVGLRLGLPAGFLAEARLRAVVLNNELTLGLGWGHRFGRWSVGAHFNAATWFGWMGVTGFDVTAIGFSSQPGLSVGVRSGATRATLGVDLFFVNAQTVNLGGAVLSRDLVTFGGFGVSLVAETRVTPRGGMFFYGVTVLATSPDYQLWVAFSPFRTLLPYPRFVAGYEF